MTGDDIETDIQPTVDTDPVPVIKPIPFDLVSHHDRKTTRLINQHPEHDELKSQNKFYTFEFEAPVFIHSIRIFTKEFHSNSIFNYTWTGIDGIVYEGESKIIDNKLDIIIAGVAVSVSFKPPKLLFAQPHISSVTIFGFSLNQAGEFIHFARHLADHKNTVLKEIEIEKTILSKKEAEINALIAQRSTFNQEISKLKSNSSRESAKLKDFEIKVNNLTVKFSELSRSISDEENRLLQLKSDINRYSKVRSDLASSIQDKKSFLSELESNINLFPSELSGFSNQGSKDVKYFAALTFIPLLVIFALFTMLMIGSADLTTKIIYDKKLDVTALIASRAPYVAISATIITACYYISRMLILEVVRISRQRLSLTKISIIAKDISFSVDGDLHLSDEEKYKNRLRLKMDLMRDHLKEYISQDFQPSLPKTIGIIGPTFEKNQSNLEIE